MSEDKKSSNNLYGQIQRRLISSLLYDSTDTIRVVEMVEETDFDEPNFALVFSAILEIYRNDEKVSVVSIAHQLETEGNLKKAGGPSELYTLRNDGEKYLLEAPVGVYAKMLKELSVKNKISTMLVDSKKEFTQDSGVRAADGIAELQSALNTELYGLSDESTSMSINENFEEYLDVIKERFRISEENVGAAEGLQGIPSLLSSLNHYTGGWLPGQLITVGARTGIGKALSLDTPIPTPLGWTTMGEIEIGDFAFGRDGRPARVTNITEIQHNRKCYKITFHNGESIIADADHLWLTETYYSRRHSLSEKERTTEEIFKTLRTNGDLGKNHSIKVSKPIELPEADLPIDPYLLGYWLGDGHSWSNSVTVPKADYDSLVEKIEKSGYFHTATDKNDAYNVTFSQFPIESDGNMKTKYSTKLTLKIMNLLENKHIPSLYLRASVSQRRELLAGFLDSSNSSSTKNGSVLFGVTRKVLADNLAELARSLGLIVFCTEEAINGENAETSICYNINFETNVNPFFLPRKAEAFNGDAVQNTNFYISNIELIESVPVRCIEVDNVDHVYLAGESMVPTHNSVFAVNNAVAAAQAGKSVLFFSLEMEKNEITDRIVSSSTGILLNNLGQGRLSPDDQDILKDGRDSIESMKIKIETEAKLTIDSIRAKALRQAQSADGLDFIIVDYLQLVTPVGHFGNRQEAVADMSRNMKLLAKQLEVPVMVLVQLNREDKKDESPIPKLHQIRESGAIAQDSDIVILLHRDDAMDDTIPHTLVLLEKNRGGEAQKVIRCHSRLEVSVLREVVRSKDVERVSEDEQEDELENFDFEKMLESDEMADDGDLF